MKENYYQQMTDVIQNNARMGIRPRLLLHVCCAPCAGACLELLAEPFDVTLLFYNPNITDEQEYLLRKNEVLRLVDSYDGKVKLLDTGHQKSDFYKISAGRENCPEGGERCRACYAMRLAFTAQIAKRDGYDYFASTLSVSPHKDSAVLNEIGISCQQRYGVKHLPNDFKKKEGYKRSCAISRQMGFYRQNYCGCEFSKNRQ
ncbi:MAG: epoxyqueuosine reductase QueH [Christensenellales bacterium]